MNKFEPGSCLLLLYLQKWIDGAKFQDLLTASIKVKGIERVKKRSERARLNIRTFLAVLISLRQTAATITLRFPGTKLKQDHIFVKLLKSIYLRICSMNLDNQYFR